ncbi:dynein axonemal assembly factor 9-like [Styela clava]
MHSYRISLYKLKMTDIIKPIAKRNKFSTSLSCQRLRSVQNLLKNNVNSKESVDAILVVLGVDGRFNEGCRELANYLTFGFFSNRQTELENSGLEEEDTEDVIFFIRPDSVSLYCGSLLYNYILPYVTHWKNLQIYCRLQDAKNKIRDTDIEENYKVKSFISMLRKSDTIGISYSGSVTANDTNGNCEIPVKKWPVMQSYASEDIGVGKDFSFDHKVINMRKFLLPVYNQCDPFVFEDTIFRSFGLFQRHWYEATNVIQNAMKCKMILQLKEEQVLEPLQCYFKHGQIAKHEERASVDPPLKPYVMFGTRSLGSSKEYKAMGTNIKSTSGKGKSLPYHMVMQCIAPNCPLVCTRTYFFKSGSTGENDKEFNDLVNLYAACVEGASIAISEYVSSLDAPKAEKKVIEYLLAKGVAGSLVFDAKCKIISCDKTGQVLRSNEGKSFQNINVIRVALENIKTSHVGEAIGSIVFCDTFIVSSLRVIDGEQSCLNSAFNVLTSDIPSYKKWLLETVKSDYKFDGQESLAYCKDLVVCSKSLMYSPCKANVRFNEDGSVYLNAANMEDLLLQTGIQYYDSNSPGKVCILVINFDLPENRTFWTRIPAQCRGEINTMADVSLTQASKCIILALMPGTPAYKEFYACVVHASVSDGILKHMKSLSSDLDQMYKIIQNVHEKHLDVTKETFQKSAISANTTVKEFVSHLTVASVAGGLPIPRPTMSILFGNNSVSNEVNGKMEDEKVPVTLIAGLPSSGAENISRQLVTLNKEKVRWVVIRPVNNTSQTLFMLHRENLVEQLTQAIGRKHVARPSAAARKKLRIVVLAVGFFDLCEIVQCITYHPDISIREQMKLGAVTTCIWPKSINFTERQNYPKFFDQCLLGVVSNFAFFTPSIEAAEINDKNTTLVQALLRSMNKQAAFLICPGGKLIRKSDFELILAEDSFMSARMQKERFMLRPALSLGRYESKLSNPSVSKVVLEFSQPLIKGTFCARSRGLKTSLALQQPTGGVCFVSGCVAFTDSPNQDFEVSFASAMNEVSLNAKIEQPTLPTPPSSKNSTSKSKSYYLEFQGMDLNKDALMDWLRKCGRQKPSKKCHKTKQHLTKDEIQMIHEENSTRRLPEGFFYNGSFYVSLFDNNKMMHHPNMSKFVDEYLRDENIEIDAYNAEIDKQNIKDVFEV